MRLATPIAIAAVTAALLAGCGSSDDGTETTGASSATPAAGSAPAGATAKSCPTGSAETEGLRATGLDCAVARQLTDDWVRSDGCATPAGASRSACTLGPYRCLAVAVDRGVAVSCARSGQSVAFVVTKRG